VSKQQLFFFPKTVPLLNFTPSQFCFENPNKKRDSTMKTTDEPLVLG
jgi:hypothetical protein